MMTVKAYLAGPDVFLPNAREIACRKVDLCARHGIVGLPPLNEDVESLKAMSDEDAWQAIFGKDLAMMEQCDIIIANLTPFRGPSADAGTLIEVGWFLGRGRPVFGYSNSALPFSERSRRHIEALPDPLPGLSVEGFGLPDNLMIPGAVLAGGGHPMVLPSDGRDRPLDVLDVFEACVEVTAWKLGLRLPTPGAPATDDDKLIRRSGASRSREAPSDRPPPSCLYPCADSAEVGRSGQTGRVDGPARAGETGTPCALAGLLVRGASRRLPPQLSAASHWPVRLHP